MTVIGQAQYANSAAFLAQYAESTLGHAVYAQPAIGQAQVIDQAQFARGMPGLGPVPGGEPGFGWSYAGLEKVPGMNTVPTGQDRDVCPSPLGQVAFPAAGPRSGPGLNKVPTQPLLAAAPSALVGSEWGAVRQHLTRAMDPVPTGPGLPSTARLHEREEEDAAWGVQNGSDDKALTNGSMYELELPPLGQDWPPPIELPLEPPLSRAGRTGALSQPQATSPWAPGQEVGRLRRIRRPSGRRPPIWPLPAPFGQLLAWWRRLREVIYEDLPGRVGQAQRRHWLNQWIRGLWDVLRELLSRYWGPTGTGAFGPVAPTGEAVDARFHAKLANRENRPFLVPFQALVAHYLGGPGSKADAHMTSDARVQRLLLRFHNLALCYMDWEELLEWVHDSLPEHARDDPKIAALYEQAFHNLEP